MRRTLRFVSTLLASLSLLALPLALTGCETVKGVGKDIQNAGEAGEEAIENDG